MQLHASAVAVGDRGCLILGASGSGKSTLALELIALGAELVADDRVDLARDGAGVVLAPPARLAGLIEARGVGILRMPHRAGVALALAVDLDRPPAERLPRRATRDLLGWPCPVILGRGRDGLASVLALVLRHGLVDPEDGMF